MRDAFSKIKLYTCSNKSLKYVSGLFKDENREKNHLISQNFKC